MNLRKNLLAAALLFLLAAPSFTDDIYVELDQMLSLKVGLQHDLGDRWGIKGSVGFPFFGFTVFTYDFAGYYKLIDGESPFRLSTEFGLNIGCVNILEGTLLDRDPIIDHPFAGFGPGINLNGGYAFRRGVLGLKAGVLYYNEYQANHGWRVPILLPEVSLEYRFSRFTQK